MNTHGKYISTRDGTRAEFSYSDVLLQGLAPDRGLYVPVTYPSMSQAELKQLAGKSYVEIFTFVKSLFIGNDIPLRDQQRLAQAAFTADKFPSALDGNIAPTEKIIDNLYIQQLSLGPTAAFKDMALQPLGQDMQYVLSKENKGLTLLGATSGDTGSAAEAAVKGLDNIKLFMLSPEEGMSDFQRAQMGNLTGGNIFNVSVPGRFDDCQDIVKDIKQDPEFAKLGAVNSINWGRIASQVPYYVSGYLQIVGNNIGQPVDFVVPTGNFGNVLAGHIARKIGVPIRRLIVATNENSVVDTLIQTGVYTRPKAAVITSSPSMDITVASNYERLVYDLFSQDAQKTLEYMSAFEKAGTVNFEDCGLKKTALSDIGFDSGCSTQQDRMNSIKWVYDKRKMVVDPHTADGITVAIAKRDPAIPVVCMSTALPVKFESTIRQALGFTPKRELRFDGLEDKVATGFERLGNDSEEVKNYIRNNS